MEPDPRFDDPADRSRWSARDSAGRPTGFPSPPDAAPRDTAPVVPLRSRRSAATARTRPTDRARPIARTQPSPQLQPGDHVHNAAPPSSSGTTVRPPLDRIAPTQVVGTSGDQPGRVQRGPRALSRANGPAQSANSPAAVEPRSTAPAIASRLDAERGHVAGTAPEPDPDVRLVRLSIRTVLSRIDVVLPERCTFAEVLETILDLSPQSLRDNAVGHGGWVLRTAAGRLPDGDSTLAATGVLDGATLFLVGVDPRAGAAVYDDIADAVAESVVHDPARWSPGARRAVTLGAAGLFAALAILAMLLSGPPWPPIALLLAAGTAAGAGSGRSAVSDAGDRAAAVVAGLISVVDRCCGGDRGDRRPGRPGRPWDRATVPRRHRRHGLRRARRR